MTVFKYAFQGSEYDLDVAIEAATLARYDAAERVFSYIGRRPDNWQLQFYKMFIAHPGIQTASSSILRALSAQSNGDSDQTAMHAIAFVQTGIRYDHDRANSPMSEGVRYPYETLAAGMGVCADKSLLLARLLLDLGYGVALFVFPRADHMALGIQVPAGLGNLGTVFAFVETTQLHPIGLIPEKMQGGIRLDSRPEILEIGKGHAFEAIRQLRSKLAADTQAFGKDFVRLNPAQQEIKKLMLAVEEKINLVKPKLRGCTGTLPPEKHQICQRLNAEHNALVQEYNALVARFNSANT